MRIDFSKGQPERSCFYGCERKICVSNPTDNSKNGIDRDKCEWKSIDSECSQHGWNFSWHSFKQQGHN